MAVGTITRINVQPGQISNAAAVGDLKITRTSVVGSASYTTGGDSLTPAQLGFDNGILFAICTVSGSAANNGAVQASYLTSAQKLQLWTDTSTALAETASTTNLSGLTIHILAFGW